MIDYTEQINLIIGLLGGMDEKLSYLINMIFFTVVVTGVIITLMLFYTMVKKYM